MELCLCPSSLAIVLSAKPKSPASDANEWRSVCWVMSFASFKFNHGGNKLEAGRPC
jgi:hypothetical protein